MHVELYLGDERGRNYNLRVELQHFETCPGQRLTTAARLSCAVAVTSVTTAGEFLAAARKRFINPKIKVIYSTYPHLTQNE